MDALLAISRLIDAVNERVGRGVYWLILAVTLISAGNAISRYGFALSSNAWLEIQWYLFSAIFLLAAGYTHKHNGHVRVDVIYSRLSPRSQAVIDIVGGLLFLLPVALLMMWMSWTGFAASWEIREMSPDAGGLIRWPAKLIIPVGLGLLVLQGVSETIKRIAFLAGRGPLTQEHAEEVM